MTRHARSLRASCGFLLLFSACVGDAPKAATGAAGDADYTVRGEIARLPDAGNPELWLRHEAIPDFRDAGGKVVGMDSMTMPFRAAPGLALAGFVPGDRVEIRLEVRWGDAPGATVAGIEKLPAGTRLAWDPPAGADAPAEATHSEATPR